MSKKELSTVDYAKRWTRTHYALKVGKYLAPTLPVVITTGVKWQEWFASQGVSLPFGFATMLIALLITIYSYSKSENENNDNKISPFFYIGALLGVWAAAFSMLANILSQMGLMFLFVVIGIFAGGGIDQFDRTVVNSRINEYNKLIADNNLDKRTIKKEQRKLKAEQERKARAELESKKLPVE